MHEKINEQVNKDDSHIYWRFFDQSNIEPWRESRPQILIQLNRHLNSQLTDQLNRKINQSIKNEQQHI